MTRTSPLHTIHERLDASFMPYGPPEDAALVVERFTDFEIEYASIRKGVAMLDAPHRGTLRVTGDDRLEFLARMLTQHIAQLPHHHAARSFWLNRKGRLVADIRLTHLPDATWFDLDTLAQDDTRASLDDYLFAEDCAIENAGDTHHRVQLHGPAACALLAAASTPAEGPPVEELPPMRACTVTVAGAEIVVDRQDETGEIGLHLLCPAEHTPALRDALLRANAHDQDPDEAIGAGRFRLRPIGWHAYNVARIEAGWPLFNLDFGPRNLPAETGVLRDRVAFDKGCYLGQEVVARMDALGAPKQKLAALRLDTDDNTPERQPESGAPVHPESDPQGKPAGAVTSSARSPMLGDAVICFAQLRTDHAKPGNTLLVETPAGSARATVQDSLAFFSRDTHDHHTGA